MKKALCILAVVLMIVGAAMVFAVIAKDGFRWDALDERNFVTIDETLPADTVVNAITVQLTNADVRILTTDAEALRIEALADEKMPVVWSLDDIGAGILKVEEKDNRKWYEKIGFFSLAETRVTLEIPEKAYLALTAEMKNGDVEVSGGPKASFADIRIGTVNGEIRLDAVAKREVSLKSTNGDITSAVRLNVRELLPSGPVKLFTVESVNGDVVCNLPAANNRIRTGNGSVIASGTWPDAISEIKTVNGEVRLSAISGGMTVETVNGDITASLMKPMHCVASSKNGEVSLPQEEGTGPFLAKSVNGDITVRVED